MAEENLFSKCESKQSWLKCRYVAILFAFASQFYLSAIRLNMGISIVAMVKNSALQEEENGSDSCPVLIRNTSDLMTEDLEEMDGEFQWSPELQGYILGCSFLFYVLATAPSAKLTDLFGSKNILFANFFLSTLFTIVSPFAAWCHVYLLIVAQSLRGLFQAGIVPALTAMVANWCPKSERALSFAILLSGSSWGAVFGSYISGLLCKMKLLGGWPLGFYLFGGTGLIVSIFMWIFMYDNPSVHPKISSAELKYILENQENVLTEKRPKTPWCRVLSSVPVYALAYTYIGQVWALSHFVTVHPTFLKTILHYPIKENGLFSALPFMLQFLTSVGGGCVSTVLSNKNCMSVNTSRKFWTFLSCLGYSTCLMGICFAGCNRTVIVVLSILSMAFTGFGFIGCWVVAVDMSPQFAASINAFACTIGFTPNFIMPVVVGFLTDGRQTLEQWHKILFISISIVMSSGIVFLVFGSAEVQPWNDVKEKAKKEMEVTRF